MTDGLLPLQGDDGLLSIGGGVGGTRFQWDELEDAARLLDRLAADTVDVAFAIAHLDRDFQELPWRYSHLRPADGIAGTSYQAAAAHLGAARASASDNSRALYSTSERLGGSLRAYHLADDLARAATEAVRSRSEAVARFIAHEASGRGAAGIGPIELHTGDEGPAVLDGTVAGVVDRLAAVENEDPGTFEVLRAGTAEDPVYVVVLPGTQSGPLDGTAGSNPFDAGGIVEAFGEDSRFIEAAVLESLQRAGAQEGDGLIVAGYSQGGLHAMNVAGSEAVGSRYEVQLVVTVGTPTGTERTGPGEYLHLEHRDDTVPRFDAMHNADDRHRTTVVLGNPVPAPARREDGSEEPAGLGQAHTLQNYAAGARLVDASDAPSLAPAAALLATAAAAGTVRRYSFAATRRPGQARATELPAQRAPGRSGLG
ncbi:hypothetical protein ACX80N_04375 [Arthrobacter sp. MDT2-16]